MKRLFLVLLFICIYSSCFGIELIGSGPTATGTTYLANQNFEGTGYDNGETWTEVVTAGTCDEDYATAPAPLLGSQSLYMGTTLVQQEVSTSVSFTDQSSVSTFVMFNYVNLGTDHSRTIALLNGSTVIAYADILHTGSILIKHGTVTSSQIVGAVSTGTTYYLWLDYSAGTGSNGILRLYLSTNGTKGTVDKEITNGDATASVNKYQLYRLYKSEVIFDHALVSSTTIGDNP